MTQARRRTGLFLGAIIMVAGGIISIVGGPDDEPAWLRGQSLSEAVAALPRVQRGQGDGVQFDSAQAADFTALVTDAAAGRLAAARDRAGSLGYKIDDVVRDAGKFVVLSPRGRTGKPTVVLSVSAGRDLIAEAPHPLFERGTAQQAVALVEESGARAAIVAGAHRCAASAPSSSPGRTRVCNPEPGKGKPQPYKVSDAAHSVDTLFHTAHLVLANLWPAAVIVQFHGMSRGRRDPESPFETWFIVSSGPSSDPGTSPLSVRLRDALRRRLGSDPGLAVSCQDPQDHAQYRYRRLCGHDNVQWRAFRDALQVGFASPGSEFLHIEQRVDPILRSRDLSRILRESLEALAPDVRHPH
ncbi:hypothetical protein ACPF7Z_07525 [Halomonas sp. GXIMD04776]|uniref:hypothetical protein n=1 Tax=Halomonas sp. GXIMD04776 TaxID=3415605 RepID=UPI003CB34887